MTKKAILMLLMLSCILFVVCRADNREYVTIEKALGSLSNVVLKYKSEFDTRVKFAVLQEAIDAIDTSMLRYQGTAKRKLDQLRALNSDARHTYHNCVGPVFEWCVSINSTFDIFIPYIKDQSLTEHDRDIIWNMSVTALSDGQKKTYNSLELIKLVQMKTTAIQNLLDSMLHDLYYDFGPDGFYGKRKNELTNTIAEMEKARRTTLIVVGVISLIFGAIATLVVGPIGIALALLPIFASLGLDAVIEGRRQATFEEELQAIQAFFNMLEKKIKEASAIAAQVNGDLAEDKNNLHALKGLITAAENNKKLLMMDSPSLRSKLVPSFQNLGKSCYEYTIWHGYGSMAYQKRRTRNRRDATETCIEKRLKAMTMTTESIPLNISFEEMVSKAYSIVKSINCESLTLPIKLKYEQPALLLLDKNDEPTTIDDSSKESLHSASNPSQKRSSQSSSIFSSKNMIESYSKYVS